MPRLDPLPPERMDAAQRAAYQRIVASREEPPAHAEIYGGLRPRAGARLGGPFEPWLRSPALAEQLVALGGTLRFGTALPPRLTELAILVVGRAFTAQFEFWAHERFARSAGVPEPVIAAIKARKRPAFESAADEAVYDLASELLAEHRVSDATYARARGQLGERAIVELTALLGFYSLVSLTLNTFEVPLPEGAEPPLQD
jgi:4-carboxymuconolactone decarboxylase